MPRQIKAYLCDFKCGNKACTSRAAVVKHEKICFRNPEMRACRTCEHLVKDSDTVYNPHHGGDPGSTDYEETFYWCDHPDHEDWDTFVWSRHCDKWELKEN